MTGIHRLSPEPIAQAAVAVRPAFLDSPPVTVGVARATARPPPRDSIAMKAIKVETAGPIRFRWRGTVYLATATSASAWPGLPGSWRT